MNDLPPPPPPPPPSPPVEAVGTFTKPRNVVLAVAAAVTLVALVAVIGVTTLLRGHPSSSGGPPSINASIVNINGVVPDGYIAGTGMVLTSDGDVITNNHVVAGTTYLTGQVAGSGPAYHATVIGVDPTHDVAVIKLDGASGLPVTPFEASGVVRIGDHVTALGNALGGNGAAVAAPGVVTSLDETVGVRSEGTGAQEVLNGLIETDAHLQPGDSGGPLVNQANHVVGMDTVGPDPNNPSGPANFGGAIPINGVLAIAHDILAGTKSPYLQSGHSGILGITTAAGGHTGAVVATVEPGDAADSAGIVTGDTLTAIGSVQIHSDKEYMAAISGRRPADRVSVTWRDTQGVTHQATVSLSPGPPA